MNGSLSLVMYLSRIDNEIFIGLDGNLREMDRFGIDPKTIKTMSEQIQDVVQDLLCKEETQEYVASKL